MPLILAQFLPANICLRFELENEFNIGYESMLFALIFGQMRKHAQNWFKMARSKAHKHQQGESTSSE